MELTRLFFPKHLLLFSLLLLLYTYLGYHLLLNLLVAFKSKYSEQPKQPNNIYLDNYYFPGISIIIAAYNEEKNIAKRIENLLKQDYPQSKLEIIVASDGSTDKTIEIAKQYKKYGVKVLDFKQNRGRAAIQNDALKKSIGEIVIFTDAETEFKKNFIKKIISYFSNNNIGCVVGNLIYKTKGTSISESEGLYWKFEKKLRELESKLGILATATGACMAVRRNLWRDLTPIDDSDFTTPLDVILQGYRVVYAPDAIAYDVPPSSITGELRARIRQTAKNLVGTLKRWGWRGWVKHPFVSWGLLSHKILRWLTPFFMLGAFISNIFLLEEGLFYQLTFIAQAVFYLTAFIGLIGELVKKRIPIASTIFSFCVANIGMGIGVIKGLIGKAPAAYKMTE
jgi:cellulose synthase/poly-beta-1,6-N-acetylglucosamine synthase-like glycosyltransferase